MGGILKNHQRAAAEGYKDPLRSDQVGRLKRTKKFQRGVYKFPDVWYNSIVILGRGRYTTKDYKLWSYRSYSTITSMSTNTSTIDPSAI